MRHAFCQPAIGQFVQFVEFVVAGNDRAGKAMRERQPRDKKQQPKTVVLEQPLTVPDMNTGLTTSSVILAKSLDPAPEQLTGQQQLEQPFTISGYRVVPSFGAPIPQASGELMFVFFIYNEGAAASGKPDVDVEYLFYRAAEDKAFTKPRLFLRKSPKDRSIMSRLLPLRYLLGAGSGFRPIFKNGPPGGLRRGPLRARPW